MKSPVIVPWGVAGAMTDHTMRRPGGEPPERGPAANTLLAKTSLRKAGTAALAIAVVGVALAFVPGAAFAGDALEPEAWSILLWSVARILWLLLNVPTDDICPC